MIFASGFDSINGSSSAIIIQIIKNIFEENDENLILLSSFDIFVFPEINPDSILLGNSKMSVSGCDLSSVDKFSKTLHPELYFFYKTLEEIDKKQRVAFFFEIRDSWKSQNHCLIGKEVADKPRQVRELPVLMSEFCSFFNFQKCDFIPEASFHSFLSNATKITKNAFTYCLKIATLDNGYGHVFTSDDYKRLADNFIHSLVILSVNRFKNVY